MNSQILAQRAYSQPSAPIRTPRGVEYEAFARITRRLASTARLGKSGFGALANALHDNRKLWTILATDVAGAENELPQDLRARIFYLAEFTQAHSRKVLSEGASVDALIEINASVMRGLRQEGQRP
ncbi:flagellar biosynthesis regulator FlaF [Thalassovita taeanensis]|uniref:Flagellar protein FlaF n=1 Tax=Thalassovita taeanensis TaxID=657014 RepID=A0A1H9I938_9RHOB|nr:flagellar biosynthesis regulator FlaF [Thalassovita taeanensis]SEQ71066.1 flagellar protein FlaF [Thalassovita taeanensis]